MVGIVQASRKACRQIIDMRINSPHDGHFLYTLCHNMRMCEKGSVFVCLFVCVKGVCGGVEEVCLFVCVDGCVYEKECLFVWKGRCVYVCL